MKKLIAILLLVCLLPLCALAEMDEDGGVTVALDGAEIYFVPMEGHCLTRESSVSAFNRLGMSQRDIVPWMEQNDVYALMFDHNLDIQIQVAINPTTELDFDEMTKYGLDMMCDIVEGYYKGEGCDVESVKVYHTFDGHSYVKIVFSDVDPMGNVAYMALYLTSQSGYAVNVGVSPYAGALTEEQILLTESVVDSLWLSANASSGVTD